MRSTSRSAAAGLRPSRAPKELARYPWAGGRRRGWHGIKPPARSAEARALRRTTERTGRSSTDGGAAAQRPPSPRGQFPPATRTRCVRRSPRPSGRWSARTGRPITPAIVTGASHLFARRPHSSASPEKPARPAEAKANTEPALENSCGVPRNSSRRRKQPAPHRTISACRSHPQRRLNRQ